MKNEHLEITSEVSSEERGKVTPRLPIWMVLLTTAITFGFAYLTYTGGTYAGLMHSGSPGFDAISWGPLSVLFISLVVVNPIGYLITKKKILSPKTMILLFVMLVAAANATALHPALWLLSLMGLSHEAGTNPMVFQPLLEKFNPMVVPLGGGSLSTDREMEALLGFTIGQSRVPWDVWLMPVILWGLYTLAFYFLGMGLAAMVRKRWTDVEHLRYPLIMPAIEMVAEEKKEGTSLLGPLWKNKIMWCGFIPAVFVVLYVQFQEWYPGLPQIPWAYDCIRIFIPFHQALQGTIFGKIMVANTGFAVNYWGISPLWLGVAYLIPAQETIIGFLVGHFFRLIPNYIFYSRGQMNSFPYSLQIMWDIFAYGAIFGLGVFVIYLSRNDIVDMFREAFRGGTGLDDSSEGLSYRKAVYMICASSIFIVLFAILLLNYKVWLALLYLAFYILILLGYTRMRATAGLTRPSEVFGSYSLQIQPMVITNFVGQDKVGLTGLTGMSILSQHDCNSRNLMMGNLLEGWKLGEGEDVPKKLVTKAMTIAFIIGMVVFYFTALNFVYKGNGISTAPRRGYTWRNYRWLAPLGQGRALSGPENSIIGFFSTGALALWFVSFMRLKYVWWPIEPVGFAWGSLYGYTEVANFMIIGIVKALILRYGGRKLYNELRPMFLGLILGWAAGNIIINSIGIVMAL